MIQSRPIDIDGRFFGVAVRTSEEWQFVALDPQLEDLHGAHFASPEDATRVVRSVLQRGSAPRPQPVLLRA
jgi:hypothetical protein